jgi:DNA-binding LacI/PurR family transcriptional regulator
VAGFDDDPVSAFLHPPLTTVHQDFAELTRLAVHHLVAAVEARPPAGPSHTVPARLTVRASTGPPPDERTTCST